MNKKQTQRIALILIITLCLFQSCITMVSIEDLPKDSSVINFNGIANAKRTAQDKSWNSKTGYEYYIKALAQNDSATVTSIRAALQSLNYSIKSEDKIKRVIFAKRGATLNEYGTVAGVYYQINGDTCEIYVLCKIEQDPLGGWRDDRAQKVAMAICDNLKSCKESYSINTSKQKADK